MLRKPKPRSHLRLAAVAPDLVAARWEDGFKVLEGHLLPLLLPYLDGRHEVADVAARLAGQVSVVDVRFGISLLEAEGWLVEGEGSLPPTLPPAVLAFADGLGLDPAAVGERLAATVLALETVVSGAGAASAIDRAAERLAAHLAGLGVRLGATGGRTVVLAADYLAPGLAAIDRRQRAAGRPWMLLRPAGLRPWIGPVLAPPATACWACLAARLAAHAPWGEALPTPAPPSLDAALELAASAAATQVLRWLAADRHPELEGRILSLDVRTLASRGHVVVRRPGCPECGAATSPPAVAVRLRPSLPHPLADGGSRLVPPEETYRRLEHHLSPLTGLVARLERAEIAAGTDVETSVAGGAVRVFVAEHLFRAGDEREVLRRGGRQKSAGKGRSLEQARASALCEALERASGVFRGDEPRRAATWAELGDEAVHPAAVLGWSAAQYRDRRRWNADGRRQTWVGQPFDETRSVDWTPFWSLGEERVKYLPTALAYYGVPLPADHRFGRADSNGCAAGNCLEEAVLQGLLELVERDAVALWWAHRLRRPGVDLESFPDPFFAARAELHRRLGRRLVVLDLPSDLGVPVFAAVSEKAAGGGWLLGFGAHPEVEVAVARALTELEQFLPADLGGRERPLLSADPADPAFLSPDPARRRRQDFPRAAAGRDLGADLRGLVERLRQRGLETLVLDQTRADVGLAVVRVVVPGLRHKWPRWGPGRLHDVPVALGWLPRPPREDELNPVHLLI